MPEPQTPAAPQVPPQAPAVPPAAPPATPPATPPAAAPAPATPPVAPSPYEAANKAIEAYMANPTPELKTAAEAALKQAKESQPAAKPVPEKYEFKLPEGSKLDAKHQEALTAFAKARGLSQEDAQALLERDNLALKAQVEKVDADYKGFVDGLRKQSEADPEIGGPRLNESVEKAGRVLGRFDPAGKVKQVLDESGYGNHPEVIRFLNKIFASMKEDELVIPAMPPTAKKTMEEKFYPTHPQK